MIVIGNHCKLWIFVWQQEDVSVQLEALDILGDLLSRFGGKWSAKNFEIDRTYKHIRSLKFHRNKSKHINICIKTTSKTALCIPIHEDLTML